MSGVLLYYKYNSYRWKNYYLNHKTCSTLHMLWFTWLSCIASQPSLGLFLLTGPAKIGTKNCGDIMKENKTCSQCGEEKPATAEFFHRNNAKLRANCKACNKAYRDRSEVKQRMESYSQNYRDRKKENPDWKPEREKSFEIELINEGQKQIALLKMESETFGSFVGKLDYKDWLEINNKYENLRCRIFHHAKGRYFTSKYRDINYIDASYGPYGHSPSQRKCTRLHRLIMDVFSDDLVVDHIDGDGLNNLRSNLRTCSNAENSRNSRITLNSKSGFKGVNCAKSNFSKLPWRARIKYNYKEIQLGTYATKEEAARAYDRKALELFGEFAKLNFPIEQYQNNT